MGTKMATFDDALRIDLVFRRETRGWAAAAHRRCGIAFFSSP